MVKHLPRERGSIPALHCGVMPATSKLVLQWLPYHVPGVIGSVVEPVSVYCDWVRLQAHSENSVSVWQHVILFGRIRPLAYPSLG